MKQPIKYIFCSLVTLFFLFGIIYLIPTPQAKHVQASSSITRVYDYAKLLTEEEVSRLEALSQSYYFENYTHFLIVTTKDRSEFPVDTTVSYEKQTELFGLAVYNYFKDTYKEDTQNCVILTLDVSSNRYISVKAQGNTTTNMNRTRETMIAEKLTSYMKDKNYLGTCQNFVKLSSYYLQVKPGINPDAIYLKTWFQILISVLLGGAIVGIMAFNSGGSITTTEKTYLDEANSHVLARRDRYIRTTKNRRKRENDDNKRNKGGGNGTQHGGAHF